MSAFGGEAEVPELDHDFPYLTDAVEKVENRKTPKISRKYGFLDTAAAATARGEPWLSLFDPAELHELLRSEGFKTVEDLGLPEITERLYGDLRRDITIGPGPHIVRAYQ